jgi:regulatory protein
MEVKQAIIRYCQYQERCHSEVRNKLYELGCHKEEVEQELATLIEIGLLNEERFARAFARGRFRLKQWGREKIKQELKVKKVSEYCIRQAMKEIDGNDYDATLRKLMDRKYEELKKERSKNTLKMKLYRYMVQKGYERDIIGEIVHQMIENKKT